MRVCIQCQGLFVGDGARCAIHRRPRDTGAERSEGMELKRAWVAANGLVCPGFRRSPHAVGSIGQLSIDHVVPVVHGGRYGPKRVLCVSCNSRRGAQVGGVV